MRMRAFGLGSLALLGAVLGMGSVRAADNYVVDAAHSAVTFKITGEAVSNNDIVIDGLIIYWDDVNT